MALFVGLSIACIGAPPSEGQRIAAALVERANAPDRTVHLAIAGMITLLGNESSFTAQYDLSGANFQGTSSAFGMGGEVVAVGDRVLVRQGGRWEQPAQAPPNPDPLLGLTVDELRYLGPAEGDSGLHRFAATDPAAAVSGVLTRAVSEQLEITNVAFEVTAASNGRASSALLDLSGRHPQAGDVAIRIDYTFSNWGEPVAIVLPEVGSTPSPTPPPTPFPRPSGTIPAAAVTGRLAFVGRWDGAIRDAIVVVDADGSDGKLWYDGAASDELRAPAWSPDGRRLAVIRGTCPYVGGYCVETVALLDSSGRLIDVTRPERDVADGNPRWSPDGTRIIFDSNRGAVDERTKRQLWVVNVDGSGLEPIETGLADARQPDWAPDGERILFISIDEDRAEQLWVARPDGSDAHLLVAEDVRRPRWSPDGAHIGAWRWSAAWGAVVLIMGADGTELQESIAGYFQSWSPTGEAIVHLRPNEEREIWIVRADGGGERRVPFHDYMMSAFDWGSAPR